MLSIESGRNGATCWQVAREMCASAERLRWRPEGRSEEQTVKLDEVLFTLDLSRSAKNHNFTVCCLKERPEPALDAPQLLLLAAEDIPAQLRNGVCHAELPEHLRTSESNEVHIIVSTKSGTGLASSIWEGVLQPLWDCILESEVGNRSEKSSQNYRIVVTTNAQSVERFARTLWPTSESGAPALPKSHTIVLLSGDGGVADLLNAASPPPGASRPLIALLPLGTGNALFHSLAKASAASIPGPSPLALALRTLFLGLPANLPVFRATFSPGSRIVSAEATNEAIDASGDICQQDNPHAKSLTRVGAIVASFGFHASIVYESDTPKHRAFGAKRFGIVAQELLREAHPYKARLSIRREATSQWEVDQVGTHAYILATMVSNLERTFTISPASRPLDGTLHLVHFGAIGGERTMDVMMKAYDEGKHVDMKWDDGQEVRYSAVQNVMVEVQEEEARWRKFCVDGTIVEVPQHGSMTVSRSDNGNFRILIDRRVKHYPCEPKDVSPKLSPSSL